MAVTLTKVSEKVDGLGTTILFSAALDTSFVSGGEPLDLTAYFSKFYGGVCKGVDAVADAVYVFEIVGPGRTVAVTSTNVLLQVLQAPSQTGATAAAKALSEATSVNLSSIGALMLELTGKAVVTTSWA